VIADPELPQPCPKYVVLRDDREKNGHGWFFPPSDTCQGTAVARLVTGDYSLAGLTDVIAVERKNSAAELSRNFFAGIDLFRAELERMSNLEYAAVVCEFPLDHILEFPRHEHQLSRRIKSRLKIDANRLTRRLESLQREFPNVQFVFDARHAERRAERFFDRIWAAYCRGDIATPADIATPPSSSPAPSLAGFTGFANPTGESSCSI